MDHPSPLASPTLGSHGRAENTPGDRRLRITGGNLGRIGRQIRDAESDVLVNSIDEVSDHLAQVLTDPGLHRRLAIRAKGTLREYYLTGSFARDGLDGFGETHCRGD